MPLRATRILVIMKTLDDEWFIVEAYMFRRLEIFGYYHNYVVCPCYPYLWSLQTLWCQRILTTVKCKQDCSADCIINSSIRVLTELKRFEVSINGRLTIVLSLIRI